MNFIVGWMMPEMNWARKLAWKSCSFSSSNWRSASCLAPEHLDDGVAGVRLLDVPVQGAGPLPLDGELLLRALRR